MSRNGLVINQKNGNFMILSEFVVLFRLSITGINNERLRKKQKSQAHCFGDLSFGHGGDYGWNLSVTTAKRSSSKGSTSFEIIRRNARWFF